MPRIPPPSMPGQRDVRLGRAQPYREKGPLGAPKMPCLPPLPLVVLSVVSVPRGSGLRDRWNGEAKKRNREQQPIGQWIYAEAVGMTPFAAFQPSSPQPQPGSPTNLRTGPRQPGHMGRHSSDPTSRHILATGSCFPCLTSGSCCSVLCFARLRVTYLCNSNGNDLLSGGS